MVVFRRRRKPPPRVTWEEVPRSSRSTAVAPRCARRAAVLRSALGWSTRPPSGRRDDGENLSVICPMCRVQREAQPVRDLRPPALRQAGHGHAQAAAHPAGPPSPDGRVRRSSRSRSMATASYYLYVVAARGGVRRARRPHDAPRDRAARRRRSRRAAPRRSPAAGASWSRSRPARARRSRPADGSGSLRHRPRLVGGPVLGLALVLRGLVVGGRGATCSSSRSRSPSVCCSPTSSWSAEKPLALARVRPARRRPVLLQLDPARGDRGACPGAPAPCGSYTSASRWSATGSSR